MKLNLPQTKFPMRPDIAKEKDLAVAVVSDYANQNKHKTKFALCFGPPFSNGHLHMGHALNGILKDFEIRHQMQSGYEVECIPGFDNNGLPIEIAVETKLRKDGDSTDPANVRKHCREFAGKWIVEQTEDFKSLGVAADWGNPYSTMSNGYEAKVVEAFGKLYQKGYIIQDNRIVPWSGELGTALATSELEFKDIEETAVFVRFVCPELDANFVIFTTTPWTLVANRAVAFNSSLSYVKARTACGDFFVVEDRVEALREILQINSVEPVDAKQFAGASVMSLFDPTVDVPLVDATFVTPDQGTGFVHIAPGFGEDDFVVGQQNGLEIFCPVDEHGRYTSEIPIESLHGKKALATDADVIAFLADAVVAQELHKHQYPHDERLHKKVIYRASRQWFINLDTNNLRERMVAAVKTMKFAREIDREHMLKNLLERPNWCVSRSRAWGSPIPIFFHKETGEVVVNEASFKAVADAVKEFGTDGWFNRSPEDILGSDWKHESGAVAKDLVAEQNVCPCWIDSSLASTFMRDKINRNSMGLAIEGQEQRQAWFGASTIMSVALNDEAPFETVATHAFVLDKDGYKMAKSKGNVTTPADMQKKFPTDVLRLWVASVDTNTDVRISEETLKVVQQDYLTIRNFFKFCLGNLSDAEVESKEFLDANARLALDDYFALRLRQLETEVFQSFEERNYVSAVRQIREFINEMNGVYFDPIKDSLYCDAAKSERRLTIQKQLLQAMDVMLRCVAPILPFLTHEVASHRKVNLFQEWQHKEWAPSETEQQLLADFDVIKEYRSRLKKVQEELSRGEDKVKPVEMVVSIWPDSESDSEAMWRHSKELATVFAVSVANLFPVQRDYPGQVEAKRCVGARCDRCWKMSLKVATIGKNHLCPRCAAVEGEGE